MSVLKVRFLRQCGGYKCDTVHEFPEREARRMIADGTVVEYRGDLSPAPETKDDRRKKLSGGKSGDRWKTDSDETEVEADCTVQEPEPEDEPDEASAPKRAPRKKATRKKTG